MGFRKSLLRLLLGKERAEALNMARTNRRIAAFPDRQALTQTYLPFFAQRGGRILWIGCRDYTGGYLDVLEADGGEVWTVELDPAEAGWGREGRHRTGNMLDLPELFPGLLFDSVLCNGVIGHGVDSFEDQEKAFAVMAGALKPDGLLLLGWNTDSMADPEPLALRRFTPASGETIPSRARFAASTHVYDLLRRNPD